MGGVTDDIRRIQAAFGSEFETNKMKPNAAAEARLWAPAPPTRREGSKIAMAITETETRQGEKILKDNATYYIMMRKGPLRSEEMCIDVPENRIKHVPLVPLSTVPAHITPQM